MRLVILIVISLCAFSAFSQTAQDSLKMRMLMEHMQKMKEAESQPQNIEVDESASIFQPLLLNSYMELLKNGNAQGLHDELVDWIKKHQPVEDFVRYLDELEKVYGKLETYEQATYGVNYKTSLSKYFSHGTYDVTFERAMGTVGIKAEVEDSVSLELNTFQIVIDDYEQFALFDSIAQPTFNYLKVKDRPGLYNSTSKRFQDYTPIAKYEEFMNQLDTVVIGEVLLFNHQIGVIEGNLQYQMTYETEDKKGRWSLTYTEIEDEFKLEGINYYPIESEEKTEE